MSTHKIGECVNVYEGMVSWDSIHMNRRSDLLREYDASVPPSPSIEGGLPGSSQALGSQHPHPTPTLYSPDPSCSANLQPLAPSPREGLQQSQGAGGQLARGLIRDLGTPGGWEAKAVRVVGT